MCYNNLSIIVSRSFFSEVYRKPSPEAHEDHHGAVPRRPAATRLLQEEEELDAHGLLACGEAIARRGLQELLSHELHVIAAGH